MTADITHTRQQLDDDYTRWSTAAAAVLAKGRRCDPADLPATPEALLSTQTRDDDVVVRPLYTRKDETGERGLPGAFPFVRGADPARDVNQGWRVTERFGDLPGQSVEGVNETILDAAGSGASGIWLAVGPAVKYGELGTVLNGVYLDLMPVTLDAGTEGIAVAHEFLKVLADRPAPPQEAPPLLGTTHSLGLSPYTAAFSGRPAVPATQAAALAIDVPERVRTFRVDGTDFAQAGATAAQELGLLVAAAVAHVRDMTTAGLTTEQALGQIGFAVSVSDDQFAAIAKLRALRLMWARVAQVLGVPDAGAALTHAVTDLSMLTQRDPWVNMLRTTVAAFGAGVGGADQVTVLGYDAALPTGARSSSPSFSARIARNTQLLLLEESNIGRVLDPAGGSWFVESLTDDLASAGWAVFTDTEAHGGYADALDQGAIARWIGDALALRDEAVAHRSAPVTGVSEFPNLGEAAFAAALADSTDLPTATPGLARVARRFEELRDRADAQEVRPSVLLLPLGSVAEHNGRTTFVSNLLGAGGIEAINPGPVAVDALDGLVADHGSAIAVLCGTKARYASDGPGVLAAARAAGIGRVLLAGPLSEWPDGDDRPDGSLRAGIDAVGTLTELLDILTTATAGA
ncbi:methylmalonyl-CoA mutase family protein [Gordonia sp. PP30]|uniref:methylmalonyl-CoA mutase family protein n=1 Tax=unclassified Gordonia (in: high G+C Gram-positive bacteria) TaxID=2657482 RepID=UPI001FFEDDF9|nr:MULTISPECIES: methylmalonyl-CoA mutase family protein [unclassified Gordonia (in: high G+C Gram-positive bacteria)]UQE76868.1 methylmalonyl-CoA mutase family protein [Gordonia sp. PP30]